MWEPRCRTQLNPCLTKRATTSRGLSIGSLGISIDRDGLGADEFTLQGGLAVLKQHLDHFMQITVKLVQRRALRMRAGKAGHVANQ
jgi:hypothetical protein